MGAPNEEDLSLDDIQEGVTSPDETNNEMSGLLVESLPQIVGGGWVRGDWQDMEDGVGNHCGSWGNATCIKTNYYATNKTELKCPENYGRVSLLGFIPHEREERVFLCVIDSLAQKNNSISISEKSDEGNNILVVGGDISSEPN